MVRRRRREDQIHLKNGWLEKQMSQNEPAFLPVKRNEQGGWRLPGRLLIPVEPDAGFWRWFSRSLKAG